VTRQFYRECRYIIILDPVQSIFDSKISSTLINATEDIVRRDEQIGLILLVIVLLLGGIVCSFGTGGGQAIGNIFANIVSYMDAPPTPTIEAQFESIKQEFSSYYWLIGFVATGTALLTLIAIIVYMIARQRIPRSWCLFLLLTGAVASARTTNAICQRDIRFITDTSKHTSLHWRGRWSFGLCRINSIPVVFAGA
jgi:hypothetical protein